MKAKENKIIRNISILVLCLAVLTSIYICVNGYSSFKFIQLANSHKESTQLQIKEFNDRHDYYEELNKAIAIKNYNEALRICIYRIQNKPTETIFIYNYIGELYNSKGDLDSAIFYFSKSIQAKVPLIAAYANRGWIYYRKDLYENAEKDLEFAAKINSEYYFALGIVQEKIDRHKAIESYKIFIHNNTDNSKCKQRLDSLMTIKKHL